MSSENLEEILKIREEMKDGNCYLYARGRIDSNSAVILDEKLESVFENEQAVIILNMEEIDYISSIGIRVILKIYKKINENGGKFFIESPSMVVKNILSIAALSEQLILNE